MEGLIQMLKNETTGKWHPIMYVEKPFPGSLDSNDNGIVRFKSKGHHTAGFENREDAIASLEDLKKRMLDFLSVSKVTIDVENDVFWTGEEIPADTVLRPRSK